MKLEVDYMRIFQQPGKVKSPADEVLSVFDINISYVSHWMGSFGIYLSNCLTALHLCVTQHFKCKLDAPHLSLA